MPENVATMKRSKEAIMGIDNIGYLRLLSEDHLMPAMMLPLQTSLDFDISRDADPTTTKDGSVTVPGGLETEISAEFIDSIAEVSDKAYTAILDGAEVELWKVNRRRKNASGQYFAWYVRGYITEDSNSNDADDASTRELTFTASGKPKRGWVTLTKEQQEDLDYLFRGLDKITDEDETGAGTAWKDEDHGTGELEAND